MNIYVLILSFAGTVGMMAAIMSDLYFPPADFFTASVAGIFGATVGAFSAGLVLFPFFILFR